MKGKRMNLIELDKQIKKHKIISAFKDGVTDAVVHGQKNDEQSHHYYKQGYDFGLFIYNELNIQGACFIEGNGE
jgi:hypothetical protein